MLQSLFPRVDIMVYNKVDFMMISLFEHTCKSHIGHGGLITEERIWIQLTVIGRRRRRVKMRLGSSLAAFHEGLDGHYAASSKHSTAHHGGMLGFTCTHECMQNRLPDQDDVVLEIACSTVAWYRYATPCFIQRDHRLSNKGGERRWPQNKTGVVHRYQATVACSTSLVCARHSPERETV